VGQQVGQQDAVKITHRTLAQIRDELTGAEATEQRLRSFLEKAMRKIRAVRFEPYLVNNEGKRIRNPLLKDVREYESTLRSVARHKASLRAEERSLIGQQSTEDNPYAEFAPQRVTQS
jgi:hypothetical protein